jgi:uncharacterized membrane protein
LNAVKAAEKGTSGEIRVFLIRSLAKGLDPLAAGRKIFEKIGMTQTKNRNGVLFLLELKHHHFVLLGDKGIHEKVTPHFWEEIRDRVLEKFKKGLFAEGLSDGILHCGEKLREYFPSQEKDINELPDEWMEG